jgi:hypothetical protein
MFMLHGGSSLKAWCLMRRESNGLIHTASVLIESLLKASEVYSISLQSENPTSQHRLLVPIYEGIRLWEHTSSINGYEQAHLLSKKEGWDWLLPLVTSRICVTNVSHIGSNS